MLQRIKKRIKKDDGNATIMLGIMLIICLIMIGGTMLDFSKAQMLKSSYIDASKKATQAGAMVQNSRGSIKAESIGTALYSYEEIMRPAIINTEGYLSKCENYDEDDVMLKVTLTEEQLGQRSDGSMIRLATGAVSRSITISRSSVASLGSVDGINNTLYYQNSDYKKMKDDIDSGRFRPNLIMLELTEGTENIVLPTGFKLTGNEDYEGIKCQKINVAGRASTFLGDAGEKYD